MQGFTEIVKKQIALSEEMCRYCFDMLKTYLPPDMPLPELNYKGNRSGNTTITVCPVLNGQPCLLKFRTDWEANAISLEFIPDSVQGWVRPTRIRDAKMEGVPAFIHDCIERLKHI